MLEPVVEVSFNLLLKFYVDWLFSIELSDCAQESAKVITVIEVLVKLLELIKDVNEVAHDIGENGDSKE